MRNSDDICAKLRIIEPHIHIRKFSIGDKAKIACIVERLNETLYDVDELYSTKRLYNSSNILTAVTYVMQNIEPDKHKALIIVEQVIKERNYHIEH